MDSCSNFDLNLELSIKQRNPNLPADHQEGDMMEVIISKIYSDNRKIRRMVAEIFQKYSSMHSLMMQHLITNKKDVISDGNTNNNFQIRKRKFSAIEGNEMMSYCSCGNEERLRMMNSKPKVSTVFIRVNPIDSSLAVKDGYQWRKYGQKVTRDNPSPRAYFKCSFAPLCLVKKKVQRSAEDPTVLVVTYEGEHNHTKPSSPGSNFTPSNIIPSSSLINLGPSSNHISSSDHLNRLHISDNEPKEKWSEEDNIIADERGQQDWILEQMASSLTKDRSFTWTLASIISDKVLEHKFY